MKQETESKSGHGKYIFGNMMHYNVHSSKLLLNYYGDGGQSKNWIGKSIEMNQEQKKSKWSRDRVRDHCQTFN